MKKPVNFLIFMAFLLIAVTPACEKDLEDPDACYTLTIKKEGEFIVLTEPYSVDAGRSIQFENCGRADFYSFFSGTPGQVWADYKNPSDTATVGADSQPGGNLKYAYQVPGQYTATIVLTNRQVGDPYNSKQIALDFVITVTEPEE